VTCQTQNVNASNFLLTSSSVNATIAACQQSTTITPAGPNQ
jgi:hypothetical protein